MRLIVRAFDVLSNPELLQIGVNLLLLQLWLGVVNLRHNIKAHVL